MDNKTIMELTAQIVASAASKKEMGKDEIIGLIREVQAELKFIENPSAVVVEEIAPEKKKNPMSSIKMNEVVCLVCGKGGFTTLTRHIKQAHGLEPKEYRKQFGLKAGTSLSAKSYVAKRKEIAAKSNLGENLKKARAAKTEAKKEAEKTIPKKTTAKPAAKKTTTKDKTTTKS